MCVSRNMEIRAENSLDGVIHGILGVSHPSSKRVLWPARRVLPQLSETVGLLVMALDRWIFIEEVLPLGDRHQLVHKFR